MSILGKAAVMRALAEQQGADPNLRRYALDAAIKAENKGAALLQVKQDRDAVLTFLLGLPADKAAPSAASIGEVLDIPAKRVQAGLDSLTRDGRLLSDGTLDPRVRANQKPGQKPQSTQPKPPVAPVRDTIAENRAVVQGMKGMVDIKSLHGAALQEAVADVSKGSAVLQDGLLVYKTAKPVTQRDLAHTRALVNKIQEGRK